MAYSEEVADRIRTILKDDPGITEKKMFGGICFLDRGNMSVGVIDQDLVLRVGKDNQEQMLTRPHTRPMDFTGRPMKSMIYVSPEGYKSKQDLQAWIDDTLKFTSTLPAK